MSCSFKPYKGKEKYIFVSYAHADKKVVMPILEELNAAGFRIWYDEGIEWGTEFNDFIATRICECDAVIAFHSKASSESEYCKHEINYALNKKKSVLSVYLEEVELSPGMAMQLSSYQSTFWYQYKDKSGFFERLIDDTPILQDCRDNEGKTENSKTDRGSLSSENDKEEKTNKAKKLSVFAVRSCRRQFKKYLATGDEYREKEDFSEATKWYEKAVAQGESIAVDTNDIKDIRNLVRCYENFGINCYHCNEFSEAIEWFKKAIIREEMVLEVTNSVLDSRILARNYEKIGACYNSNKNFSAAKEWCEKAKLLRESLVSETNDGDDLYDLAALYYLMGVINQKSGDISESKWWYEQQIRIFERLASENRTLRDCKRQSKVYEKLDIKCKSEGNFSEARKWYEKVTTCKEEETKSHKTVKNCFELSEFYNTLAVCCLEEGEQSVAVGWLNKAIELTEQVVSKNGDLKYRHLLSNVYYGMGIIRKGEGNLSEAREWFEKCAVQRERVTKKSGSVNNKRELLEVYEELSNVCNSGEEEKMVEKVVEIAEAILADTSAEDDYDYLVESYIRLGKRKSDVSMLNKAKEMVTSHKQEYAVEKYTLRLREIDNATAQIALG